MKGIILAGGSGTRLFPNTKVVSKQLLPIYDKPLIYYPLSVLMLMKIKEILVITNPAHMKSYQDLLEDGSKWGLSISYAEQEKPRGIAEALIIGEKFINGDYVTLILGDNIFYGNDLIKILNSKREKGATIYATQVKDPERYGVINFDSAGKPSDIEEKPIKPRSSWAVTGLYTYPPDCSELARRILPSKRGEIEITELNNYYLRTRALSVIQLGRGTAWLDTGTFESMMQASQFVQIIQERTGLKIADLEEIAQSNGWING